jgi:hypothetical protein
MGAQATRKQWRLELANLYVELGVAKVFLQEAEQGFRTEHVDSAREQVASLTNAIGEHRCNPWWSRFSVESTDRESDTTLT